MFYFDKTGKLHEANEVPEGGIVAGIVEGGKIQIPGIPLLGVYVTVESVVAHLQALSAEQRIEVFSRFCRDCGAADPGCQCWNDE